MVTFLLHKDTQSIRQGGGMQRLFRRLSMGFLFTLCLAEAIFGQPAAQKTMTWQQAREEFEKSNPTLRAARIGIDESRDEEVTAYLRPNPDLTVSLDQINPFTKNPIDRYSPFSQALPFVSGSYLHETRRKREVRRGSAPKTPIDRYSPFSQALPFVSGSYLHERRRKRELRLESAQKGTAVAQSQLADQERNLIFNLRNAFVQALQAKAVRELAKENLVYFDHELSISQERYKAGDIARVD